MKKYIPRNWGWYVAAGLLFGPYLLIALMEDDVMARIIALVMWGIAPICFLAWSLLQKKNTVIVGDTWLTRKITPGKLLFWSKIFLLVAICMFYKFMTLPIINDVKDFDANAVSVVESKIIRADTGTGALSITLYVNVEPYRLNAYYFPRNTFEEGYTYKLWYLPNTKRVVDAELISTNN